MDLGMFGVLVCSLLGLTTSLDSTGNIVPITQDIQTIYPFECPSTGTYEPDFADALQKVGTCLTKSSFTSCQDVLDSCGPVPSGMYNVDSQQVYCDMVGSNCDNRGGWTRIALFDTSIPGTSCPSDLTEHIEGDNIKMCSRTISGCSITTISSPVMYSSVCGRVLGYQYGSGDAFRPYRSSGPTGRSIDLVYLDGVSLTYGPSSNYKHIWSYVNGYTEVADNVYNCPCNVGSRSFTPTYVGDNYYCESAIPNSTWTYGVYLHDVLWDGKQCNGYEGPCCSNRKLPWFFTPIDGPTDEDVTVRVCTDQGANDESITITLYEIYVR